VCLRVLLEGCCSCCWFCVRALCPGHAKHWHLRCNIGGMWWQIRSGTTTHSSFTKINRHALRVSTCVADALLLQRPSWPLCQTRPPPCALCPHPPAPHFAVLSSARCSTCGSHCSGAPSRVSRLRQSGRRCMRQPAATHLAVEGEDHALLAGLAGRLVDCVVPAGRGGHGLTRGQAAGAGRAETGGPGAQVDGGGNAVAKLLVRDRLDGLRGGPCQRRAPPVGALRARAARGRTSP